MNLSTIRNAIKIQVGETSGTNDSIINAYINWGQQDIASRRNWDWQKQTGASFNTSANTEEYTLASDSHKILGQMRDTTNEIWLQEFNYDEFVALYPNVDTTNDTGKPLYWYPTKLDSSGNQLVKLYPVPAGTYTIKYDYIKRISDLSIDSDVSIIPVKYHPLLIDYGLARWYEKELEFSASSYFDAKYQNGIQNMLNDMYAETDNEASMQTTGVRYTGKSTVDQYFINL